MPFKCTLSYHADSTNHVYSKAYPYYITHTQFPVVLLTNT